MIDGMHTCPADRPICMPSAGFWPHHTGGHGITSTLAILNSVWAGARWHDLPVRPSATGTGAVKSPRGATARDPLELVCGDLTSVNVQRSVCPCTVYGANTLPLMRQRDVLMSG